MVVVHKVTLSLVHETTFLVMRIKLMRFALSVVYTNPTRLLPLSGWISSLQDLLPLFGAWDHSPYGAHWAYKGCYLFLSKYQAYTVLWNFQECYSSPGRLVATVIELLELLLQG